MSGGIGRAREQSSWQAFRRGRASTLGVAHSPMNWQDWRISYAELRRWTMRRMEWTDVQVFVAVREGGSIGAAARHLAVNHSTVLRRIGALEQALGVRLFDRLPRGYALTAEGHEFAAGIAGVSEQMDAAERRVSNADRELRGRI